MLFTTSVAAVAVAEAVESWARQAAVASSSCSALVRLMIAGRSFGAAAGCYRTVGAEVVVRPADHCTCSARRYMRDDDNLG